MHFIVKKPKELDCDIKIHFMDNIFMINESVCKRDLIFRQISWYLFEWFTLSNF